MGRAEEDILRILRADGAAYQADIVRATGLSKATVSEAISDLESRRIVRRESVGRSSRVSLVAKAHRGRRLKLGFTRAAEYPFLVPLAKSLKGGGVDVEFKVYDNGLEVARDLSTFAIDVGVAPVISLFMLYSLEAPLTIIGPAGSGGSSVMGSPKPGHGEAKAVCTKMSTMELLMRSAVRHHAVPELGNIEYASTPDQMADEVMSGRADLCSIWEPYATMLEDRGARRLLRYSDLSDHVCCAFAAGNHLGDAFQRKLARHYSSALAEFSRDRDAWTAPFAALAGLEASTVRRVAPEYSYPREFSYAAVARQLEDGGLSMPSPSSIRGAVLRE